MYLNVIPFVLLIRKHTSKTSDSVCKVSVVYVYAALTACLYLIFAIHPSIFYQHLSCTQGSGDAGAYPSCVWAKAG